VLNCRTAGRLFVDFFAEDLPTEYRELLEEHLAECPSCLALAESYRAVIRLARQLPRVPLPPELLDNFLLATRKLDLDWHDG
jgi:hypothetical protein